MEAKQYVGTHIKDILIIVLLLVVIWKSCGKAPEIEAPTVTIVRDTVWIVHDSTVYSKPVITNTIVRETKNIPTKYITDTTYAGLKKQYEAMRQKYLAMNIQKDSLKIDTVGVVRVTDSVTENMIVARKWDYQIKMREITNTITITQPAKKRRQIYGGISIGAVGVGTINMASLKALYKDRKENIIGIGVGWNIPEKSPQYTLEYHKILSLRSP